MKEANYADLLPIMQHLYYDCLNSDSFAARCFGRRKLAQKFS